jgi:hypothetical protein
MNHAYFERITTEDYKPAAELIIGTRMAFEPVRLSGKSFSGLQFAAIQNPVNQQEDEDSSVRSSDSYPYFIPCEPIRQRIDRH